MYKNIGCKKVSIIIPVYNVEKYLERCLLSVVKQTYTNLEIILVNDGSTDLSGEICRKWCMEDERIIYVEQENKGVSTARNRGLELSTGEYIAFVDADDWIALDMFSYMVALIEQYDGEMVRCDFFKVYSDEKDEEQRIREEIICFSAKEAEYEFILSDTAFGGYSWGRLYKRNIIKNVWFDEKIYIWEDTVFTQQVIKNCKKVIVSNQKKYYYYQNTESALHQAYSLKNYTVIRAIEKMKDNYISIDNKIFYEKMYILHLLYQGSILVHSEYEDKWNLLCEIRDKIKENKELKKYVKNKQLRIRLEVLSINLYCFYLIEKIIQKVKRE